MTETLVLVITTMVLGASEPTHSYSPQPSEDKCHRTAKMLNTRVFSRGPTDGSWVSNEAWCGWQGEDGKMISRIFRIQAAEDAWVAEEGE